MKVQIKTSDWTGNYEADSGQDAVKKFFADIFSGKIKFCQLGSIGQWYDGKEWIPFRIAPAMYKAGKITFSELRATLKQCGLDFSDRELEGMAAADFWMLEGCLS